MWYCNATTIGEGHFMSTTMRNIRFVRRVLLCGCLTALAIVSTAAADNPPPQVDFPQSGLLAGAGNLPSGNLNLPMPVGLAPGVEPPITGSISKGPNNKWQYAVTNNFDKPVRVSASLRQFTADLKRIGSSPVTVRLKPGETEKGELSANPKAAGGAIVMESWTFTSN
jgi:hypothetical protein